MRKTLVVLVAMMMVGMTIPAFAELQNVKVGGSLRIRANWYFEGTTFDKDLQNDTLYVEQRTKVNVSADFTDDVHAFIELDHYGNWGDYFRGLDSEGLLTGADGTSNTFSSYNLDRGIPSVSSTDNYVNLYQAYVEMKDAWGAPIDIKIGRSEMQHGDEFLVGNNDTSSNFRGLSFDGIWLKYNNDKFNVQGFVTRVMQDESGQSSGDADFMGVYGSYTGIENMSIDGYYYYYHAQNGPTTSSFQTDNTHIHTLGLRFAGNAAKFDWALNGAYQFGDSGVRTVNVDAFAVQGSLGYTFDVKTQPHLFIDGAYYDGANTDSNGNVTDAAFNRLFSDHEYSEFLDATDMSNFWTIGGGVSAQVTEKINIKGLVHYYQVVEDFGASDDDLGLEVEAIARYNYSEDLYFEAGYAHFFTGDSPVLSPGDDNDYVYVETGIKF